MLKLSDPDIQLILFCFTKCLQPFLQEGWTPLHVAVQSRNRDIAKVLLVNGADKTRRNKVKVYNCISDGKVVVGKVIFLAPCVTVWKDTPGSCLVFWQRF